MRVKRKKFRLRNRVYFLVAFMFFIFSIFIGLDYYKRIVEVYSPSDVLQVNEKNEINYSVYLLENEYIEQVFLGMNENYLYSYTDYISIVNNYSALFTEELKAEYRYKAIITLIARHARSQTASTNPEILNKSYTIENESDYFNNKLSLEHTYEINLNVYKEEAEKFAETLDIPVSAEIRVDFIYDLIGEDDRFRSNYIRSMTIPLSDEVFQISLSDNKEKVNDYSVSNDTLFTVGFYANTALIILCYVIIFLAIKVARAAESLYKETINKYLRTYDDVIINTSSPLDFDKYEMLMIDEFKELLDLANNTSSPIMFYENNQGGLFYVFTDNMVYMHIVS